MKKSDLSIRVHEYIISDENHDGLVKITYHPSYPPPWGGASYWYVESDRKDINIGSKRVWSFEAAEKLGKRLAKMILKYLEYKDMMEELFREMHSISSDFQNSLEDSAPQNFAEKAEKTEETH